MDIIEILAKAFDIGNTISFTVNIYENDICVESKVMTYTELGLYMINIKENILRIDIIMKPE